MARLPFRKSLSVLLRLLPWAITLACVVKYLFRLHPEELLLFDDAYMFVRYADNLLQGAGYAWNAGEGNTFGSTSIAYTFLIAGGRWAFPGLTPSVLLIGTSGALGLAAFAMLAWAARAAAGSGAARYFPWFCAGMAAWLLRSDVFIYHARTGMDTMLAVFANALLLLAAYTVGKQGSRAGLALAALCAYSAFLVRPDNGLYAILAPAILLALEPRTGKRKAAFFLACLALMLLADTLGKWLAFGDPLPLTFHAKRSGYLAGYSGAWNPAAYLFAFAAFLSPFLLAIGFTVARRTAMETAACMLPLALTLAFYFTVVQIMGFEFRFYFPSLPFLVIPAWVCLGRYLADPPPAWMRSAALRCLWLAPVLLLFHFRPVLEKAYARRFLPVASMAAAIPASADGSASAEARKMDWWGAIEGMSALCDQLPPGSLIAASEYGYLAAMHPHLRFLDLVGLHDPEVAHHGLSMEYVLGRNPDLVWLPHSDYRGLRERILASAAFRERYALLPEAFAYGLAYRRNLPPEVARYLESEYRTRDSGMR